jgi:CNT family concentrative nucleoside transporter
LVVRGFAWFFSRLMRISGAESLCASVNIFTGVEANFSVRPYLAAMTASELCLVLCVGMSTVAANILGLYIVMLKEHIPAIAAHLMAASVLSAPAAIIMAKVILPETGLPVTLGKNVRPHYERDNSLFEAIINGSMAGLKMIAGAVALLIAVLGLVALCDMVLGFAGSRINGGFGINLDWSLKGLAGYVMYPFTLLLGVPVTDANAVSKIIGSRSIVTEVSAFADLAALIAGKAISPRSAIISAYVLCGFTHVASLAIFVGGIAALAPGQAKTLSKIALRSFIAATLATLMVGAVAGVFVAQNPALQ